MTIAQPVVCVVCGSTYMSKHAGRTGRAAPKYCSNKCKCKALYKKKEAQRVVCVVCGITFFSMMTGRKYNAPKFCSQRCFSVDWKRKHPEKVKASRRKTHLKHREKDLKNNQEWWRKNANKLKPKRAEYQKLLPPEKRKEYSRRYYNGNQTKERNRAYVAYYLGHENPKGDLGWLRRAKTTLRNAQRLLKSGETPEACITQRTGSKPDETSQT